MINWEARLKISSDYRPEKLRMLFYRRGSEKETLNTHQKKDGHPTIEISAG